MTTKKTRTALPVGERTRLLVAFYPDEYDALNIDNDMTLGEAQEQVRSYLPVVAGRRTLNVGISALGRAYKDADSEKRARVMRILAGDDSDEPEVFEQVE